MTTQTAPPVQFIRNLHMAARALSCGQHQLTGEHLARAVADAPTPELAKVVGDALLQNLLGPPGMAEHFIAMALGMVEVVPLASEMEDERPKSELRLYCEKLQADRAALLFVLRCLYSNHVRVMHLGRACTCGFWNQARAAIKECEGK